MTQKSFQNRLLLAIGIIILLNILSARFWARLDFTADKRYTLSNATLNILQTLSQPVTITAYFSENLPPNIAETRNDFKDLLIEYANRSDGQVVYEFINPADDQTEQQAQSQGIAPVMVNLRERDQVKQQRAYLGAVVQIGEQKDVIPFIQPGAAMEYALSSSIKKLSVTDKPKIGFLQGNGEPAISAMQQAVGLLTVLYSVEELRLNDTTEIPAYFKTISIIAPKDSIPESQLHYLDKFLEKGGRILIAMNRVDGDLSQSMGISVNTGLEKWLERRGIIVQNNFLVDANCGAVSVRRQQGFFSFSQQVQFPYFPVITNFANTPITKGIESVLLPFASPISFNNQDGLRVTVLAESSPKSGKQNPNMYFDISKQWTESDFPDNKQAVAILAEGIKTGGENAKLIVFGDGDFAVNGEGQTAQQLQQDNVNLLVNAIDFLSDDTGLNELRTKGVTSRPIKTDLEDSTKTLIKYANFLLPLLLIIIYGLVRAQYRRRMRLKWMSENYA